MRLIHLLLTLISMAQRARDLLQPPTRGPFTLITIHCSDDSSRSFHYNRVLGAHEAYDVLDCLLDEMIGAPFSGPAEVHRHLENGNVQSETVGLLPVDD